MNSDCGNIIRQTVKKNVLLAVGIVIAVCGAVVISLLPPLVLAKMIDAMTQKQNVGFTFVALYFGLTALTGVMEASREGFLTVFGQKITHALRSSLMEKFTRLTADSLNKQEPGALVSRFVGDVDTVENLFTSGIISMFADACRIKMIFDVLVGGDIRFGYIMIPVCTVEFIADTQKDGTGSKLLEPFTYYIQLPVVFAGCYFRFISHNGKPYGDH